VEELLALLGWAVFEVLLVGTGSLVVRLVSWAGGAAKGSPASKVESIRLLVL
jgi:hypothetical protein